MQQEILLAGVFTMISHCANPDCGVPFHHLRGGRLFRFEVKPSRIGDARQSPRFVL
jgi:hypothetical protein